MSPSSPAYAEQLTKRRARLRRNDVFTGGWVICDCSWVPHLTIRALKVYRRPSPTKEGRWTTFASCDRCGQTRRYHGKAWTIGKLPVFALDDQQVRVVMRAIEGWKRGLKTLRNLGGENGHV